MSKNAENLWKKIYERANEIYGAELPSFIADRLEREIKIITEQGYADCFETALTLLKESEEKGYPVMCRATTGNLLTAFLLGITTINPLPPHYICSQCHHIELCDDAFCGVDLKEKHCEKCGALMSKDGFHLPAELHLGVNGDRSPHLYFNIAPEMEARAQEIFSLSPYFEILCTPSLSLVSKLESITQVKASDIPLDDKETLQLFRAKNTCGLPEFYTHFSKNMIAKLDLLCFDDLVRASGLAHSANAWDDNAEDLLTQKDITLSDVISTRDDVMLYLMKKGYDSVSAWKVAEQIRKGRGLTDQDFSDMLEHAVPTWYAESCNKVKYLFPKAHCISQVMLSFQLAYYKAHYPLEFYSAYFSQNKDLLDAEILTADNTALAERIPSLKAQANDRRIQPDFSSNEKLVTEYEALYDKIYLLETCIEMHENGYEFLAQSDGEWSLGRSC